MHTTNELEDCFLSYSEQHKPFWLSSWSSGPIATNDRPNYPPPSPGSSSTIIQTEISSASCYIIIPIKRSPSISTSIHLIKQHLSPIHSLSNHTPDHPNQPLRQLIILQDIVLPWFPGLDFIFSSNYANPVWLLSQQLLHICSNSISIRMYTGLQSI